MKQKINRRDLFKLGVASAAVLATGKAMGSNALAGTIDLVEGGKDFSPKTGAERKMIPSACWNCVTRDSMIGFVEDGRLVKLEGHPDSIRGLGKICSKGAAGINQLYDRSFGASEKTTRRRPTGKVHVPLRSHEGLIQQDYQKRLLGCLWHQNHRQSHLHL